MPRTPQEILDAMKLENKLFIAETELENSLIYAVIGKAQRLDNEMLYGQSPQQSVKDSTPIRVPTAPPEADIDWNIRRARVSVSPSWFLERLAPGGEMDYKLRDSRLSYEDFGNFNYGAVALAFGLSEQTALRGAGLVQAIVDIKKYVKKNDYEDAILFGRDHLFDSLGPAPFGDQPKDQEMIKQGFRYYKEVFLPKYSEGERLEEYRRMLYLVSDEGWESLYNITKNIGDIIGGQY